MEIQTIAEHILKRMPKDLSKMEQARYIYIELGKMVTFDENYWLGNNKEKHRIYKTSMHVEDFKDLKSNRIICVSLSSLYNKLLQAKGIKATQEFIQTEEKEKHAFSLVEIDGDLYKMDLQRDLHHIQAKMKTFHFMETRDESDDLEWKKRDDFLVNIDKRIGYSYDGEDRLKDLFNKIYRGIQDYCEDRDKIKFVLNTIGEYEDIRKMGYTEKMWFYDKILGIYFNMEDGNKFCQNDLYIESSGRKKFTRLISSLSPKKEPLRMVYSPRTGNFVEVSEDKLSELINKGFTVMYNKKIPKLGKKIEQDDKDR